MVQTQDVVLCHQGSCLSLSDPAKFIPVPHPADSFQHLDQKGGFWGSNRVAFKA